ncbi:MAG: hypothetical protein VB070_00165 [Clostridiaceae bacterium]|nr:hypothetical protein [Clostridiaceae bacterium]
MTSIHLSTEPLRQSWSVAKLGFRKNKTTAITGLILMLVTVPVILLLQLSVAPESTYLDDMFQGLITFLMLPISLIMLILAAGLMFGYLHNRAALDVFHTLPIRRVPLAAGRFLAGYLLVFIPQAITFLVIFILRLVRPLDALSLGLLGKTAGSVFLMSLAVYAVSVLAFVMTGTIFDALFLTALLNLAYPATLATLEFFIGLVLPGFTIDMQPALDRYLLLSPVGRFFTVVYRGLNLLDLLWWVLVIAAMIFGILIIYKQRKSERAGNPFTYHMPFLINRFLACLVIGLYFGYLFYQFKAGNLMFAIGVLIGSFTTHLVIEVILSRGFGAFKRSLVSYAVYLACFIAGCAMIMSGFFGFDYRLPDQDKIVRAELTTNDLLPIYQSGDQSIYPVFEDEQNLLLIRQLHEHYLAELPKLAPKPYTLSTLNKLTGNMSEYESSDAAGAADGTTGGSRSRTSCRVAYYLVSGQKMVRTIYIDFAQEPYAGLLKQLQASNEYKLQRYAGFLQPVGQLKSVELFDKTGQTLLTLTTQTSQSLERLAELQTAVKADLAAGADSQAGRLVIGCFIQDGNYNSPLYLTEAFGRTLATLRAMGLSTDFSQLAARYSAAYVVADPADMSAAKDLYSMGGDAESFYPAQYQPYGDLGAPYLNNEDLFVKISDPALIAELYQLGEIGWSGETDGCMVLFAVNGQVQNDGSANSPLPMLYLPESKISENLKQQLELAGLSIHD